MYDKKYYETQASEEEYLAWYLTQDHPTYEKASITTDMVAFKVKKYDIINKQGNTEDRTVVQLLMVRRGQHPYRHKLAFPGGFMDMGESLEECAKRELKEETGVDLPNYAIEQLGTYSAVDRDPRSRVVTVPYLMYLPSNQTFKAGDDAVSFELVTVGINEDGYYFYKMGDDGSIITVYTRDDFAFDHYKILEDACLRIKGRLSYWPSILHIFDGRGFTIREASEVFACFDVKYQKMNQSNFKRDFVKFFDETDRMVERLKRPANVFEYSGKRLY